MIITRYLIKEIAQTLFGVCLVLMLIGLSGQLVGLFAEVTAGNLSTNTVMIVLGLKTLKMLLVIFPLSLYLSVLMTLSQLYKNNEMAALSACGISQLYILRAVISIALLFSIFVGMLSLQIVPWANFLQQQIVDKSKNSSDFEGMTAGRFREMSSGVGVMYIENINEERTQL
ncbi:MAG: LptF/LptG family permease, partial [Gammaproteobacteria bacterium]|nr:LptF/LptG family permease [Gammaproteobacteria bacterium]